MAEFAVVAAYISAALSVVSLAMTLTMDTKGDQSDNGNNINRKGADNPKIVPFGKCMVPAVRVWNNVNNNNSNYLAQSYSMGVGQLKSIEEVFIDGVPCFDGKPADFDKWYDYKNFNEFPNVSLGIRAGLNTETAWENMIANGDGEYTESSRGDRTATINMLIERWLPSGKDNDVRIMVDSFKVEALIEGNPVIDPRYDLALDGIFDNTKRAWINDVSHSYRNPACVVFTYLIDNYYGVGIPSDAIDLDSFIELANYCEANRIYFDGYVAQDSDFGQILLDMVTSFDGVLYIEDGLIKVKADRPSLAVAHITEDDLVGSFKLSNANESSYYNIVSAEFVNTDSQYAGDKYVLPSNIYADEQIKIDGFEKSKSIKFPYTCDGDEHIIIKRFANKKLKQGKFQKSIEFELDNTKKVVQIHDVIELTNDAYKLDRVKFRITKVQTSLDEHTMTSKISATEYNEVVYDESEYSDGVTSGKPSIPSLIIPTPVGLVFKQLGFGKNGKGVLSWTIRYNRECRTVVEYKLSSASDWKRLGEVKAESYDFESLRSDKYDFRVMTLSYNGSTSDWTLLSNVVVSGANALPPVNNFTASFSGRDCLLNWSYDKSAELEVDTVGDLFSHYEIIVYKGASHTYAETITTTDDSLNYTLEDNIKSGINRDLRFEIRVVSIYGLNSAHQYVDADNVQVTQPSGVEVNGKLVQLTVKWDDPAELVSDYAGTEVHISNVSNFTPSPSTLEAISNSPIVQITKDYKTTHYVRVGHYDLFGRDGISYSAPIAFSTLDIDDMLTDSPMWGDVNVNLGQLDKEIEKAESDIRANATSISNLSNTVGSHGALISSNAEAIQSTVGNLASYKTEVAAEFNGVKSGISSNATSIANTNSALASYKTEVASSFGSANSAISQAQNTANTANQSVASLDTRVTAEIGGVHGSINSTNSVVAGVDGKVNALNQTMIDVNGKTSGLIMGNNGVTSTTDVIADRFRVSSAAGSQAVFEVNSASGEVLMKNALIKNLTATNIQAGSITGNSIASNTKIIAGSGTSSATLDGADPTWGIYAGHSDGNHAPFRVTKNGGLYADNANLIGNVTATSGTIGGCSINNGVLSVPSANITGKLTADQIVTDTLVLKGQALTIRKYWQTSSVTTSTTDYTHVASLALDYPTNPTAEARISAHIVCGGSHSASFHGVTSQKPSRYESTPIYLKLVVNGKEYLQAVPATLIANYEHTENGGGDGNANRYTSVQSYALMVNTVFIVPPIRGNNVIEVYAYGSFSSYTSNKEPHTLTNMTITLDGGVAA